MKRKTVTVIAIAAAALMICASAILLSPEKRAVRYYEKHISQMKSDVETYYENGRPIDAGFGAHVSAWEGEHKVIEYTVAGFGIAPASGYYGVFYSEDNVPAAFQNANEELIHVRDGEWEWHGEGDNRGYVRRLEPFWFYFEAHL